MRYEVVPYRSELKAQVVDLQQHLWSSSPTLNAAYLEWKYEQNPYLQPPSMYLALAGSEVVGMRGICGSRWEFGVPTRSAVVPYPSDLVIAPPHRNRGLVSRIMKMALRDLTDAGYEYVFNMSASPVTFVSSRGMGWQSAGPVGLLGRRTNGWRRHQRALRYLRELPLICRYSAPLATLLSGTERRPFRTLDRNASKRCGEQIRGVTVERAPRPEAMADLVHRLGSDGRIRHVRDTEYFSWRFRNPLATYRFLFCGNHTLKGYLVLEKSISDDADPTSVKLADWEAVDPAVGAELLAVAIAWGRFEEITAWSATLPEAARARLREAGFERLDDPGRMARYRPGVLVRPVRDRMLDAEWVLGGCRLLDLAKWDLRPIYAL